MRPLTIDSNRTSQAPVVFIPPTQHMSIAKRSMVSIPGSISSRPVTVNLGDNLPPGASVRYTSNLPPGAIPEE